MSFEKNKYWGPELCHSLDIRGAEQCWKYIESLHREIERLEKDIHAPTNWIRQTVEQNKIMRECLEWYAQWPCGDLVYHSENGDELRFSGERARKALADCEGK